MYGGNTTEIRLVSMHVTVTNKLASFAYAFVPSCLRNNCLIRLLIGRELDYLQMTNKGMQPYGCRLLVYFIAD